MFIDLNFYVPSSASLQHASKKGKGKQQNLNPAVFTPAQISAIEQRIDLLVHLGYTVIALTQTVYKKLDAKAHINLLDPLLAQLRRRTDVVFLKRLTIVLDEESEKGFGLTNANSALVAPYDILALTPTTATTFSLACLTHTLPSPLTAHVISLPLTLPRLPFHLKHTLVRTALKNGAVFEINYAGALGGESEGSESGTAAKRNWWAAAREVVRITKGKGIVVSGGVVNDANARAPRDVANLITMLGLAPDAAHAASTKTPQSLILRAQTRRTYRAVFSDPKIVIPDTVGLEDVATPSAPSISRPQTVKNTCAVENASNTNEPTKNTVEQYGQQQPLTEGQLSQPNPKKRPLETDGDEGSLIPAGSGGDIAGQKKKRKKGKGMKAE